MSEETKDQAISFPFLITLCTLFQNLLDVDGGEPNALLMVQQKLTLEIESSFANPLPVIKIAYSFSDIATIQDPEHYIWIFGAVFPPL